MKKLFLMFLMMALPIISNAEITIGKNRVINEKDFVMDCNPKAYDTVATEIITSDLLSDEEMLAMSLELQKREDEKNYTQQVNINSKLNNAVNAKDFCEKINHKKVVRK